VPKEQQLHEFYFNVAFGVANLSKAKRLQVGAVVTKDGNIISIGYNGTPHGWSNNCETEDGITVPEVIHAEMNCILKLAKGTQSSEGAILYVTHSPCFECAKNIAQSGIEEVHYVHEYRDTSPLEFLEEMGISSYHHPEIKLGTGVINGKL
jgi:dCMP deaminase